MELIRTIAHAPSVTLDQIANTKSTNVIQIHVAMEQHVLIIIRITRVTAPTALLVKIVLNIWIGVRRVHVKMVQSVRNMKTRTNVNVQLDGLGNCATSKWCRVKMLPFEKVSH